MPPEAVRHQIEMDLPENATPAYVIDHFNLPANLARLVFIDGVYVDPEDRAQRVLAESEEIAIFPPVAGG